MGVKWLVFILLATGCVPARTPAQLSFTAEPAVIVSDSMADNGIFRVTIPEGWEVVTGMENGRMIVLSQGDAWLMISPDAITPPTPQPDASTETRTLEWADQTITVIFSAPKTEFAALKSIFERVANSLQPT